MYRGLPCPYGASMVAATYFLTGGHLVAMRLVAIVMILFMVDQGFYPHDKVLESQAWKKAIFAGGMSRVFPGLPNLEIKREGVPLSRD